MHQTWSCRSIDSGLATFLGFPELNEPTETPSLAVTRLLVLALVVQGDLHRKLAALPVRAAYQTAEAH